MFFCWCSCFGQWSAALAFFIELWSETRKKKKPCFITNNFGRYFQSIAYNEPENNSGINFPRKPGNPSRQKSVLLYCFRNVIFASTPLPQTITARNRRVCPTTPLLLIRARWHINYILVIGGTYVIKSHTVFKGDFWPPTPNTRCKKVV